jgi:ELWxxDGT repeat protein
VPPPILRAAKAVWRVVRTAKGAAVALTPRVAFFLASGVLLAGTPAVGQFTNSYKVAEIAAGSPYYGATYWGSGPTLFVEYQGSRDPSPRVYFFASQGWDTLHTHDETGLYRTDGTRAGTSFVAPFTDITEMAVVNGKLLISGSQTGEGRELWSYDGSTDDGSPATLVKDIRPGGVASDPTRFFVVPAGLVDPGELLLFAADPDGLGLSLQVSDGTTAGTAVLETFKDPREFIAFNGRVFLTAKVSQAATETNLWSWSPTAGSQLVESRVDGILAAVGSTLFVGKRMGSMVVGRLQTEVWKTDGTPDAATQVSDLWPGGDAAISDLTAVGTTVFFAACDPAVGRGLYKTDGTTVTLVKDFLEPGGSVPWPANSCDPANGPSQLAAINGKVYFVVDDGDHGLELWTSDGTTVGTVLVQDLYPGAEPSDPSLNASSCGRSSCRAVTAGGFFFTARTGDTGRELWYCNGSSIVQAGDPNPGSRSGVASDRLVLVNDEVFFAGNDEEKNSEPWALPLTPSLSVGDVSVSESAGTATLTVRLSPPNPAATVAVDWTTSDGTASSGSDFTASSGTLTFAPGDEVQTITVPILDDAVTPPEGDEVFHVQLANATNARIVTSPATVTVYDDDGLVMNVSFRTPPGTPTPPFSVYKEGYNATFDVTMIGAHAAPIYVDYVTVGDSARPVTDFTAKSSLAPGVHTVVHTPLVFPAWASPTNPQTVSVTVATKNDSTYEEQWKYFRLELFNPVGASIGTRSATAPIENDDIAGPDGAYWPTVNLASKTVVEDNTFATFRATLNHDSEYTARLYWYSGVGGEDPPADPGLDYRNTSGFFVFRPGETTHDVTVEVFEDTIDEPDEKYWVDIVTTTAVGAYVGVGRGVGIITDDDTGTLAVANPAAFPEGDTGASDVVFDITLSTPYYRDFTIGYATSGGTATPGADYTAVSGTLLFPKGTTSRSIAVPVLGDVIDEANETFNLVLSASTGPGFSRSSATATIADDDTTVSVADASAGEGNTGTTTMTFTVSTADNAGNKVPFTVDYATVAGGAQPATPGTDYVETSGTLSFPAGTKSRTFTVTINSDLIDEPAETFLVQLSNSSGPVILDGEAVGTINDNDTATVTINNVTKAEGDSGTTDAVFTVSLNTPYYRDFTVNWATTPGTATEDVDYVASSGIVTFTAGTTTQTVAVPIIGDTLNEANETFEVVLSGSTGPSISDSRGLGTITDDDALTIGAADVKVVEGNSGTTLATFTITVSRDHAQQVTCNVATSAGGPTPPAATAGTDYVTLPSTLVTFAPGVLSQQVSVTVNGDTTVEAANESFGLTLSSPTGGATLARTKAYGIILDDDSDRTISLSPLAASVTEPLAGTVDATFTVSLNVDAGRTVTVGYATADGSAQAGADYAAASGTLSFAPGERTKTVDVSVLSDAVVDGGETFTLTLSSPTNGTISAAGGTATVTIRDSLSLVPLAFYTVTPCRLVDTRNPAPGSPLVAGTPRTFPVTGNCGIPVTAKAISYNVTVAGATKSGNVRLFPGGTPAPSTSAVNFSAGQVRANNGLVALGTDGDVGALLSPAGTAHVIVDVNGYWE